jgi:hypothetical protein
MNAKTPEETIYAILEDFRNGERRKDIARRYNVHPRTVYKYGRTLGGWRLLGNKLDYKKLERQIKELNLWRRARLINEQLVGE